MKTRSKADDDTDGDGAGVDRVVPHTLEDDTGTADDVDDGGETGLKTISAAPRAASEAPSTAIPMLAQDKAGASLAPSPVIAQR